MVPTWLKNSSQSWIVTVVSCSGFPSPVDGAVQVLTGLSEILEAPFLARAENVLDRVAETVIELEGLDYVDDLEAGRGLVVRRMADEIERMGRLNDLRFDLEIDPWGVLDWHLKPSRSR
jgi:hypothetical protein